ncbi:hypothetical protein PsorP6_000802 [Peronosclerospora sorghi]|uniref:Uncharacterized protein n=1 Tax=Peronosclerospora sorghi TaxID=230839 RepID=A0ACC0WSA1_9STRA|nr:hypothetical protein PsorP6_000802 [Peronosclerospora sorghi]
MYYLLVDAKVGDQFVRLLEKKVVAQYGGATAKESDSYGRMVNKRMYDRLTRTLEQDRKYVTHGGATDDKQRFIAPTLLNFRTELSLFTSCASMGRDFRSVVANLLLLCGYHPFRSNGKNKERVVNETLAGSMVVNDVLVQLSNANVPFGGCFINMVFWIGRSAILLSYAMSPFTRLYMRLLKVFGFAAILAIRAVI